MADSFALALQKTLISKLKNDSGVKGLVASRVYDEPPQSATLPLIRLGALVTVPLRSDCGSAADIDFSIEVHSRPNSGRVEATRIAEAVVAALDTKDLNIDGFSAVKTHWQGTVVSRDPDGESYIAVLTFETILEAEVEDVI